MAGTSEGEAPRGDEQENHNGENLEDGQGVEDDAQTSAESHHPVTRRGLLVGGAAAGAAALVGSFAVGRLTSGQPSEPPAKAATSKHDDRMHFESTNVTAPKMTVVQRSGATAAGLLFTTPMNSLTKTFNGAIVDGDGEPVWLQPGKTGMTDLRVQQYQGRDVLTFWSGDVVIHHGTGVGVILDDQYNRIARISAGNGQTVDLHEFKLTDRGTALITAYGTARADLRPVGGPRNGWVFEGHVQEIDIATGKILLDWASLEHVPVAETYQGLSDDPGQDGHSAEAAFDYIHLNAVDDDGDTLYVSGRHTSTIYRIDRKAGTVLSRFGGRKSDIAVPAGGEFTWQHDVRHHDDGTLSLFDNAVKTEAPGMYSRGMIFRIDDDTRTATLLHTYSNQHLGAAMGNVQYLPDGHRMVGWGAAPYATEFTRDGKSLYDINLGGMSYRVYRSAWHATPSQPPDVTVVRTPIGHLTVNVSWNGATDVRRWRILAGTSASALHPVVTHRRTGFETSVEIGAAGTVSVEALDASGAVIGRATPVDVQES
jgi:hypothetical protein